MKVGKRRRPVFSDSSSEDDAPLASSSPVKSRSVAASNSSAIDTTNEKGRGTDYEDVKSKKKFVNGNVKGPAKKKVKVKKESADSEVEQPIKKRKKAATKKKVKEESDCEADSEENIQTKKRAKKAPAINGKLKKEGNDVDMDTPKKSAKKDLDATPKKGKSKTKEEEEEEVYRWWEAQNAEGDGSEKWKTLEHNGVIFPPPYEPLPKDVKMKYNGGLR